MCRLRWVLKLILKAVRKYAIKWFHMFQKDYFVVQCKAGFGKDKKNRFHLVLQPGHLVLGRSAVAGCSVVLKLEEESEVATPLADWID